MFTAPRLRLLISTIALAGALGAAPAHASQVLKVDLRLASNDSPTAAPAQSYPLVAGAPYVVTVSGTGSIWGGQNFPQGTCGVPEEHPMEPSPGAKPQLAGWDAETVFGAPYKALIGPLGHSCGSASLPLHVDQNAYSGFQIQVAGQPWDRPDPVGGRRTVPRSDHTYAYQFTGTGAPLRFRFADQPVDDNSGVFTVTVMTQAECDAIQCLAHQQPIDDQLTLPQVASDPQATSLEGTYRCGASRTMTVTLNQPRGDTYEKTKYYLNDQYQRTVSAPRITVSSTSRQVRRQIFVHAPRSTVKLRVEVTTIEGELLSIRRTIGACRSTSKTRVITFN
jgi:hypothetical protein